MMLSPQLQQARITGSSFLLARHNLNVTQWHFFAIDAAMERYHERPVTAVSPRGNRGVREFGLVVAGGDLPKRRPPPSKADVANDLFGIE
jgi:hypothetical protein